MHQLKESNPSFKKFLLPIIPLASLAIGCSGGVNKSSTSDSNTTAKEPEVSQRVTATKFQKGKIFDPTDSSLDEKREYFGYTGKSNNGVISNRQFLESAKIIRRSLRGEEFKKDGWKSKVVENPEIRGYTSDETIQTTLKSVVHESNFGYHFWMVKVSTSDFKEDGALHLRASLDYSKSPTGEGLIIGPKKEAVLILKETKDTAKTATLDQAGAWIKAMKKSHGGKDVFLLGRFVVTEDNRAAFVVEHSFPNYQAAIEYKKIAYGKSNN